MTGPRRKPPGPPAEPVGTWRPSARQAAAAGLERRFYPGFLRDLVDYDYADKLPLEARQWLGAFTEEHYRGWRLRSEQQITSRDQLREAGACKERLARRAKDAKRVGAHVESLEALRPAEAVGLEASRAAQGLGCSPEELSGRNVLEDLLIERVDRALLVAKAVQRAAVAAGVVHPAPAPRVGPGRPEAARPPARPRRKRWRLCGCHTCRLHERRAQRRAAGAPAAPEAAPVWPVQLAFVLPRRREQGAGRGKARPGAARSKTRKSKARKSTSKR